MRREIITQMFDHTDRPHAGATPSMGDAKGFMEIEMTDIRPKIAGTAKPHLGIHVGAVHVNLPAIVMNDFADFHDPFLKNSVSGRISHHEAGKIRANGGGFDPKIGNV